jgi:hypothetical protein
MCYSQSTYFSESGLGLYIQSWQQLLLGDWVAFVLQQYLCTPSQVRCHDARCETIETPRRCWQHALRWRHSCLPLPALHDHVLAVDGTDTIAIQLRVVLVYDRVCLAGVDGAPEIPEAGAVEVDVAGADHALVNAYSTLGSR